MAEDQEEAETIQQGLPPQPAMLPIQNIRGQEGEAALDYNNNVEVEESRELGARKKVINLEKRIINKN